MNFMNAHFQVGFIKAAIDNGFTPLQAVELLKLAGMEEADFMKAIDLNHVGETTGGLGRASSRYGLGSLPQGYNQDINAGFKSTVLPDYARTVDANKRVNWAKEDPHWNSGHTLENNRMDATFGSAKYPGLLDRAKVDLKTPFSSIKNVMSNPQALKGIGAGAVAGPAANSVMNHILPPESTDSSYLSQVSNNLRNTVQNMGGSALAGGSMGGAPGAALGAIGGGISDLAQKGIQGAGDAYGTIKSLIDSHKQYVHPR